MGVRLSCLPFLTSLCQPKPAGWIPPHSRLRCHHLVAWGPPRRNSNLASLTTAILLPNPKGCELHEENLMFLPPGSVQGLARVELSEFLLKG